MKKAQNIPRSSQDIKSKRVADKYNKEHENDNDVNNVIRTFYLTKHQIELARVWLEEHQKHCAICKEHRKASKQGVYPLGGWCEFSYQITPTDVADLLFIRCNECGAEYYLGEV